jgi:hypothetical protein
MRHCMMTRFERLTLVVTDAVRKQMRTKTIFANRRLSDFSDPIVDGKLSETGAETQSMITITQHASAWQCCS